jgi:hypothetical protein
MTTACTTSFTIELPEGWTVHRLSGLELLASSEAISPVFRQAMTAISTSYGKPDLVATLELPLVDPDGALLTVLLASIVVYCIADPDAAALTIGPKVRRQVSITNDISADFWEMSSLVVDPSTGHAALATFTTPNLPYASEMEPGFRSIAASIRFEPATEAQR